MEISGQKLFFHMVQQNVKSLYTYVHMHVYIILTWINKYVKCMLLHRPFVLKLSIIYRFSYLLTDSPLGYVYITLAYFSNWCHGFFCSWTSYLYLNVSSIYPPLSYPSTRKPKSIIFPIGRGLSFIRFFSSFGLLVGLKSLNPVSNRDQHLVHTSSERARFCFLFWLTTLILLLHAL